MDQFTVRAGSIVPLMVIMKKEMKGVIDYYQVVIMDTFYQSYKINYTLGRLNRQHLGYQLKNGLDIKGGTMYIMTQNLRKYKFTLTVHSGLIAKQDFLYLIISGVLVIMLVMIIAFLCICYFCCKSKKKNNTKKPINIK